MSSLSSPQVDEFIIKSTSGPVYHKVHKVDELKFFKSTSGRVHYKVDKLKLFKSIKWTSSSHGDALKLSSPQVDKFIKWTGFLLLSPQVDGFIIRTSNKAYSLSCLKENESTKGTSTSQHISIRMDGHTHINK